jgi:RNA polymerase sigma-70 factor, ECF subfamily
MISRPSESGAEPHGGGDFLTRLEAEIPALRRYAISLVREGDRANDLVQDCVERALSRRHLWRRPFSLRGWLFRIMHNIHANNRRAISRRPASVPLDTASEPRISPEQLTHVELTETLQAFERLSEEQREVLVLIVVEGLTYRQAAKVLGIPLGTVVSGIARARERLSNTAVASPVPLRRVK